MLTAAIDFETYYSADVDVATLGPWRYHQHPDTRAYLVSVAGDDGYRYAGPPEGCDWARLAGAVWVSHNAPFDQCAYLRLGAPGGGPAEWHCTANLAAYLQAPRSLAGACRELLGVVVDKSARDRMKGVRWAELNAIGRAEMCEYGQRDADLCLQLWLRYGAEWPEAERTASSNTARMFMRGIPINVTLVNDDLASLNTQLDNARAGIPWQGKPLAKKELEAYCKQEGIPYPKSQAKDNEDFQKWLVKYSADHPGVACMGRWRSINVFACKVKTLLDRTGKDGVYRAPLLYCGAQPTARWSGKSGDEEDDSGYNPLNLPQDPIYGVDMRAHWHAPEGYTFVIVDLGQIEPRVLAKVSGNERFLDKVRAGWHPYEAYAAEHGYEFERGTLKKTNKRAYNMSKAKIIALGYGMGWEQYIEAARKYTNGDYVPTPSEAQLDVKQYRREEKEIVEFWAMLDRQIDDNIGGDMQVTLPSGRVMRYFNLQHERTSDGRRQVRYSVERGSKRRRTIYGPKLAENICQGIARDILRDGVNRMEEEDIGLVVHVYDEAVALCRTVEAEAVSARMIDLMTTPPEWMPDIPLAAEATISEVYCK